MESLRGAEDPAGWAIETTDGIERYRATLSAAETRLRLTIPAALCAVLLAVLAVGLAQTSRRRSWLVAAIAAALAGVPYMVAALDAFGWATVALGVLLPAGWIAAYRLSARTGRSIVAAAACAAVALWVAASLVPQGNGAANLWIEFATAVTVGAMLVIELRITPQSIMRAVGATRAIDAAAIVVGVMAAFVLTAIGVPPIATGVIIVIPVLLYARSRTAISELADRVLLSELREREAIRATEEERARMSREIHDDPLQALAGVIAQLEDPLSDRATARAALRDVADHLRGVATELHPPVLDDLGLAPAIEALGRSTPHDNVHVTVTNEAGYAQADRPPADVELAAYRIVQEALNNATRHAAASTIRVDGTIARDSVVVSVSDDGDGFRADRPEDALKGGRLGMASMRRRAASIDGSLTIESDEDAGTRVRLAWER